jgi:hypothetical protein
MRDTLTSQHWSALGRDFVRLPNEAADNRLYANALEALTRARDSWRQRAVTISETLGEDYWIEPRPVLNLESLWLGRIHLGYVRPNPDGRWEAFTTDDDPIGQRIYPTCQEGLLAVQGAWRTHLRRILRITRQPDEAPFMPRPEGQCAEQPRSDGSWRSP